MSSYVQGTLFEKGYLLRTLGAIAHDPDVALTELVANCWDAGAATVHVTIPDAMGGELKVSDDGAGMVTDEFLKRWMKLGYDRQEHQGKTADFPPERSGWKRIAYGHNGVGRHGLLCFSDDYEVTTTKQGKESWFHVSTLNEDDPFVVLDQRVGEGKSHGTLLVTKPTRHLPDALKLRQVLGSRFIHDPQFTIFVNGVALTRTELAGNKVSDTTIKLTSGASVVVTSRIRAVIRHPARPTFRLLTNSGRRRGRWKSPSLITSSSAMRRTIRLRKATTAFRRPACFRLFLKEWGQEGFRKPACCL